MNNDGKNTLRRNQDDFEQNTCARGGMKRYYRLFAWLFISLFFVCSCSRNKDIKEVSDTQASGKGNEIPDALGKRKNNEILAPKAFNKEIEKLNDNTYLIVDLSGGGQAEKYPFRFTNEPPDVNDDKCRTTELWLRKIPAGRFIMGSPEGELGRNVDEAQHEVRITKDFYIGIFEFTQKQWELVMGAKETGKDDCNPVEYASYEERRGKCHNGGAGWPNYGHAVDSDSFLGIIRKKTGLLFDLPTEAAWEYACRAGTTTALNSGKDLTNIEECPNLNELGRYFGNSKIVQGNTVKASGPKKVGSFKPNAWGLYDMHGNVEEWCLDYYGAYSWINKEDPVGMVSDRPLKVKRVMRSGCCMNARFCRSASRRKMLSENTAGDISMCGSSGFRIAFYPSPYYQGISSNKPRSFYDEIIKSDSAMPGEQKEVDKVEALIMACKENDTLTMEKLLKDGLTPNCIYNDKNALLTAIKEKNIEAVEMLVKFKVDLNPDSNISPLQYAIQHISLAKEFDILFRMVKLFVENGADVNADTGFSSAFSNAIYMIGNLELVKYLHEHGAVIKDGNPTSRHPEINEYLKQAFKKQDPKKVELLKEQKRNKAEEKRKRDAILRYLERQENTERPEQFD